MALLHCAISAHSTIPSLRVLKDDICRPDSPVLFVSTESKLFTFVMQTNLHVHYKWGRCAISYDWLEISVLMPRLNVRVLRPETGHPNI
jgi:hypothetical protein